MSIYTLEKTVESTDVNQYDVFSNDDTENSVAYIVEYFLEKIVYEIHFKFDEKRDEFVLSATCDSIEECLEYLD
jgi:hypothetical protein